MPGLNELIGARGKDPKGRAYAELKKSLEARIVLYGRTSGLFAISSRSFTYLMLEPNRRRDPSNVMAGGIKLIEDALQRGGWLSGDGWKQVSEIRSHVAVSKSCPGVLCVFDSKAWGRQSILTQAAQQGLDVEEEEDGE